MKNNIELLAGRDDFPTAFDVERVRYERRCLGDDEVEVSFHRLKAGKEGEDLLVDYLKRYGCEDWFIGRNLWMDYYGRFESDVFLFTRRGHYIFEVKNYEGQFVYRDGNCWLNNWKLSTNCVSQVRRAVTNFEGMCKEAGLACKPKGVLAMVGRDSWARIEDEVRDITVLNHGQLMAFVKRLKQEDERGGKRVDFKGLLDIFKQYQIENPFRPEMVSSEEFARLRKGICCGRCGKFSVEIGRWFVKCACGFEESRESAIVRTICDYGVINYQLDLKTQEVLAFFGGDISRGNLITILQKHFEAVDRNRYSYYKNKKLPYDKLEGEFELETGRRFYCAKEDILYVEK